MFTLGTNPLDEVQAGIYCELLNAIGPDAASWADVVRRSQLTVRQALVLNMRILCDTTARSMSLQPVFFEVIM